MKFKKIPNATTSGKLCHLIDGKTYEFEVLGIARTGTYNLSDDTISFDSVHIGNTAYMGYISNYTGYAVIDC